MRFVKVEELEQALEIAASIQPTMLILDIEPWLVHWSEPTASLDEAARAAVLTAAEGAHVILATNSRRFAVEQAGEVRLIRGAHKPWTRRSRLGNVGDRAVVVGDCVVTDGMLAWRLGGTFVYVPWHGASPIWARILYASDRILLRLMRQGAGSRLGFRGV